MAKNVWVLTIEHRHGMDTSVFERKTAAEASLHDYVVHWWKDLGASIDPLPETANDPEKAVSHYFENVGDEWYTLTECHLEDGMPPDPPPKERRRVIPLCTACGTSNVVVDAYAAWDADQQKFELSAEFDQMYCEGRCGGECNVDWVELTPELLDQAEAEQEDES